MAFDEDAADGFRPPPHPDDRLWRHPSELGSIHPDTGRAKPGRTRTPPPDVGGTGHGASGSPDSSLSFRAIFAHLSVVGGVAVLATALALMALGIPQQMSDPGTEVTVAAPAGSASQPHDDTDTTSRAETAPTTEAQPAPMAPQRTPQQPPSVSPPRPTGDNDPVTADHGTDRDQTTLAADLASLGVNGVTHERVDQRSAGQASINQQAPAGHPGPHRQQDHNGPFTHTATVSGVRVTDVVPDGPADGLLAADDLIVTLGGHSTPDREALTAAIATHRPGDQVRLGIYREGEDDRSSVTVTLRAGSP